MTAPSSTVTPGPNTTFGSTVTSRPSLVSADRNTVSGATKVTPASIAWPVPAEGTDDGRKIDDMWHAAINSRGKFFVSNSPAELAQALVDIVSSITARRATATAATVSLPIVTASTEAFKASFDTSDWSGTLAKFAVDQLTGQAAGNAIWDAAPLLTARAPSTNWLGNACSR